MGESNAFGTTGDSELAPGESAAVNVSNSVGGDSDAVARADVTLDCGMFADGVYRDS
ncbi:hypothetical protein [Halorientalis sp.]|uniref:hypothetical protein n=1 Tax=Halorientalis sp. TaxID=1931229 RepID=UPI00260484D9|nr:hypothetical protein [Halorientalis sp.]